MKSFIHFLMFLLYLVMFLMYTYLAVDLGRSQVTRTVIDKDLCYAVSSQQGQYIGFKLTLDKGYTAYICKGKVE
jgi:hypothetical protein